MRNTLKATVPALALLAALTACGQSGTGSASPAGTAKTPASSATTGKGKATTAAPVKTKTATSGKTGACRNDDLAVNIAGQPVGDGTTRTALVTVTNATKQACTVHGWLTITLVNAANEPVKVPTGKVDEPGPAENVEIAAGTSAFAGIKWTSCDKADASCGVGNTIRFDLGESADGPVAELEGFPAAESSGITMKSLTIGTLQPSRQGVVAW